MRGLVDGELALEHRRIDPALELVGPGTVDPRHAQRRLGVGHRGDASATVNAHRCRRARHRSADVHAGDFEPVDLDSSLELERLLALRRYRPRRQPQELHAPSVQQFYLQILVEELPRRPLQRDIVGDDPRTFAIAQLGMREAQIVGEMPRQAGDDDLPSGELSRRALYEPPAPVHVGGDENEAYQRDGEDEQAPALQARIDNAFRIRKPDPIRYRSRTNRRRAACSPARPRRTGSARSPCNSVRLLRRRCEACR